MTNKAIEMIRRLRGKEAPSVPSKSSAPVISLAGSICVDGELFSFDHTNTRLVFSEVTGPVDIAPPPTLRISFEIGHGRYANATFAIIGATK